MNRQNLSRFCLCLALAAAACAQAAAPLAASAGSRVLLTPGEISALQKDQGRFSSLLTACTAKLSYQPHPVAVLDLEPHYNAAGRSAPSASGQQLGADSAAAYRLALCFLISKDERYAAPAQRILDAWATTLRQVTTQQARDNINFDMPYMIIAASWVRGASNWNSASFDRFLTAVVLPQTQASNPNNHGVWGVFMEAAASAYLGERPRLTAARARWQALLKGEVAPDGSMPREMERSGTANWRGGPDKGKRGLAYTHYTLLPAALAAKIFADQQQPVWQTPAGQLLGLAFGRAAAWTLHPETFPYFASNHGQLADVRNAAYFPLLLRTYPNADAQAVLDQGHVGMNGFLLLQLFGGRPAD